MLCLYLLPAPHHDDKNEGIDVEGDFQKIIEVEQYHDATFTQLEQFLKTVTSVYKSTKTLKKEVKKLERKYLLRFPVELKHFYTRLSSGETWL